MDWILKEVFFKKYVDNRIPKHFRNLEEIYNIEDFSHDPTTPFVPYTDWVLILQTAEYSFIQHLLWQIWTVNSRKHPVTLISASDCYKWESTHGPADITELLY